MRFLASVQVRVFLVCWIVFSLFFATNVVREHYPAFALIERGDFVCDRYANMHADLFQHTDGHWYVGNNVLGSLIAVPPLLLFEPLLDRLEQRSLCELANSKGGPEPVYDTKYPNRQKMWRLVKAAGLDLRFGASTVITSVLLMAPLSALFAVLVLRTLLRRGVERSRAVWLAFLFAFGTPVLYRTAHLNHNMFLMQALFGAFLVIWLASSSERELALGKRVLFGTLLGIACALDYAGFVPALVLFGYFFLPRWRAAGLGRVCVESVPMVLAGLPWIAFLLATQWWMYGDPLTPGQMVMPQQNEYVDLGTRGMGGPQVELFLKNLVAPGWGLFTFGPLLLFALWPVRRDARSILAPRERTWAWIFSLSFMLFCASNWYSLLQFNTGFRYLLPVVPFLFLLASESLARLSRGALAVVTLLVCLHGAVLGMTREVNDVENELRHRAVAAGTSELELDGYWRTLLSETPIPRAWRRVFVDEGPQLPWLSVLRQTQPALKDKLANPLLPLSILVATLLGCWGLWRLGARLERKNLPAA